MRLIVPRIEHHWERPVVLSTSSATGMQALTEQATDQARCWYRLIDLLPCGVAQVVATARLNLLELEIWPQLLLECRRQGIPCDHSQCEMLGG